MAITFGSTSAPSNITTYLDSVFSSSLANYGKGLKDNIGAANAVLHDLIKGDMYQSANGGTYLTEQLMYALAPMDSYDGYDELSTATTDGISQVQYEWRQMASPISYNMKEVVQNMHRILDLVDARIQQSELGIQEGWAQAFMWGNVLNGGNIYDPRQSTVNSSLCIEPLPRIISYDVTSSRFVGNIDQSTATWWRNKTATSAATTYTAYMYELLNMYNLTALGTGGPPTHILMDQVSFQLFEHAYFSVYKQPAKDIEEYPFVAKKFLNAKIIMDDKVPDFYSNAAGTLVGGSVDPTTMTYGSAVFINSKFFKIRYFPGRDFELLKDENGKGFVKPINGDSRVGSIAWMGQVTCSNRRKQGVLAKIARTLS
jgi:hypothetical protein